MLNMISYLKARYMSEKAQGLVEYVVLVAAIVVVVATVIANGQDSFANALTTAFSKVTETIEGLGNAD